MVVVAKELLFRVTEKDPPANATPLRGVPVKAKPSALQSFSKLAVALPELKQPDQAPFS